MPFERNILGTIYFRRHTSICIIIIHSEVVQDRYIKIIKKYGNQRQLLIKNITKYLIFSSRIL